MLVSQSEMMELCCDLQVDVNGHQLFWVNKKILSLYSSKMSSLFDKRCNNQKNNTKVIFQDFPGGPDGFELLTRFCYNKGVININHSNVVLLNHASKYMEMNYNVFGSSNLADQTEKFLEGFDSWTWSELLVALNQGNRLFVEIDSVSSVRRLVNGLVERLAMPCKTDPSSLSSNCSSFRSSCDSKSTQSTRSCFRKFWWFEDLSTLNIELIDMVVKRMVLEQFNHFIISKFLFYYQRVRILRASKIVRSKIIEMLINLLVLLDKRSISIKGLLDTLRIASKLKIPKSFRSQVELLIGSQLDQAVLDDLLLPSPNGKKCTVYNVNLVVRFLKNFLLEGNISDKLCSYRLKKVAQLVDLYAYEIAPDAQLKPSKFIALVMVIPDTARDSYDKIYQAIEIFLEVHPRLGGEEKMKVCSILNYDKISAQVLNRLSRNSSVPIIAIIKALVHQNPKLTNSIKNAQHLKFLGGLAGNGYEKKVFMDRDEVIVKALATNEKLRAHLQEMGWTLLDLEKIFHGLLAENITNIMTTPKLCCVNRSFKNLPKLCS